MGKRIVLFTQSDPLRLQEWQQKCTELEVEEARHGMALQAQLLHSQLANQAADLQRRLLWDAANYQALAQQQQAQAQAVSAARMAQQQGSPTQQPPPPAAAPAAAGGSGGGSPMQFSASTWQMEPAPAGAGGYVTRSGELAAAFAARPMPGAFMPLPASPSQSFAGWGAGNFLVPSPTSD